MSANALKQKSLLFYIVCTTLSRVESIKISGKNSFPEIFDSWIFYLNSILTNGREVEAIDLRSTPSQKYFSMIAKKVWKTEMFSRSLFSVGSNFRDIFRVF